MVIKMDDETIIPLIGILLCLIFLVSYIGLNIAFTLNPELLLTKDTKLFQTSNNSDSMGILMRSYDDVYAIPVNNNFLMEGRIYIYEENNRSIVHRLIKCIDIDCNQSVFKGDNNRVGEIVNKSQIKYRVKSIGYN